jgi:hypothetical protein
MRRDVVVRMCGSINVNSPTKSILPPLIGKSVSPGLMKTPVGVTLIGTVVPSAGRISPTGLGVNVIPGLRVGSVIVLMSSLLNWSKK